MSIIAGYMIPHSPTLLKEAWMGEEPKFIKIREAYEKVAQEIALLKPDTILIASFDATKYDDYIHVSPGAHAVGKLSIGDLKQVEVAASYDQAFTSKLNFNCKVHQFPGGILGERFKELDYGTMIPLYFINKYYKEFSLVRTGVSNLSVREHYKFGSLIQKTAEQLNRRVVIIASESTGCDETLTHAMKQGEFLSLFGVKEEAFCLGQDKEHPALAIMAGALNQKELKIQQISEETDDEIGHSICAYLVTGEDLERDYRKQYETKLRLYVKEKQKSEDAYVSLARAAISGYLSAGKVIVPGSSVLDEMKEEKAGVLVSIKRDGRLRGCAGSIIPVQNSVAEEIVNNAVSAACYDIRFAPITKEELLELIISVDVFKEPEEIATKEELDPKKYGVIVTAGEKSALILPDFNGGTDARQQVLLAKQRAGIHENEKVTLARFEVTRHE